MPWMLTNLWDQPIFACEFQHWILKQGSSLSTPALNPVDICLPRIAWCSLILEYTAQISTVAHVAPCKSNKPWVSNGATQHEGHGTRPPKKFSRMSSVPPSFAWSNEDITSPATATAGFASQSISKRWFCESLAEGHATAMKTSSRTGPRWTKGV